MMMDGPVLRLSGVSVNDHSHGWHSCPGGKPHSPQQGFQQHRQQQAVTVTSAAQISGQCLQTPARSQLTLIGGGTKERDAEEKVSERTCTRLINKHSLLLPEEVNCWKKVKKSCFLFHADKPRFPGTLSSTWVNIKKNNNHCIQGTATYLFLMCHLQQRTAAPHY